MRRTALILLAVLPTPMFLMRAEGSTDPREVAGHVGQIAGGAVYIDLGRDRGLSEGDTVTVSREGVRVGRMVVVSTASRAAACRSIGSVADIRVGDRVAARVGLAPEVDRGAESPAPSPAGGDRSDAGRRIQAPNQIRGRISLGSLLSDDLTGSGLDFAQPALTSRVTVDRIAGTAVSLTFRQRSRYYGRETALAGDLSRSRWAHEIYEFAFEYDEPGRPVRLSAGRFIPDRPRGIGLIDGVMLRYRARESLSIGVTGGTRPDPVSTGFRSGAATFGVMADYRRAIGREGSTTMSAALVGSYAGGEIDREYVDFEGGYTNGERLSLSNSIELDLNRGWRGGGGRGLLALAGLYLTARYRVRSGLTAHVSYDTRRSNRDLENRAVPDSLFDGAFRKGFHAGAAWAASSKVHLSGGVGARLRDGTRNTLSGTGSARVRDFPLADVTTTAQIALFRSTLGRSYRPSIGMGLSPVRGLALNLRGGDTIYTTAAGTSHNPWLGSFVNYRLSGRHYVSASFTGYLSDRLRSARLFAETGLFF